MPDWKTWLSATPILWKTLNWLGDNPGIWLIAAGLGIALVTLWKAPKVAEGGDPAADKVDAAHPLIQVVLRLISNGPRMAFSFLAVLAFLFGILDLTGKVPLSEKRAQSTIEEEARPSDKPEKPAKVLPIIPNQRQPVSS